MVKSTHGLLATALLAVIVGGCLDNDWEEKEQNEKKLINEYLRQNNITDDNLTQGGIYFVEEKAGTGKSPQKDNYVIINYVGRYLEDNAIHETNYDSLSDDWDESDLYKYFVYGPLRFQYGYSIQGINEGLSLMHEGGKATLVIPSSKAFYDFKPLVYEIELLKVIRKVDVFDDSVRRVYMSSMGYDSATTYYKGVYFKETFTPNPSDTRTVQQGDTVQFNFTAMLLDGLTDPPVAERVFDSNEDSEKPVKYLYDSGSIPDNIISIPPGLKVALDTMRAGTRARVIMPYVQGFGKDGLLSTRYGYIVVPKYQTLVYDLELLTISAAPAK